MSTIKEDLEIGEDSAFTNLFGNLVPPSTSQTQSSDGLMTGENVSGSRDQTSVTYEAEDAVEEPLTSHWYRLTTAQKNRCRQRIASW